MLAASLAAAGFDSVAVLSANLVRPTAPHPLSSRVTGHVVKDVSGVRIGIFCGELRKGRTQTGEQVRYPSTNPRPNGYRGEHRDRTAGQGEE